MNSSMNMLVAEREERRYSVPNQNGFDYSGLLPPAASEDLHAWSIYRQNLNSDFTDSALGSSDKSPLPYGNFQLRDTTVQSILNHPRYGPKSPLGSNMYTYLKFGLPRVFPPNGEGSQRSNRRPNASANRDGGPPHNRNASRTPGHVNRGYRDSVGPTASSGYDSSDNENTRGQKSYGGRAKSMTRKFRSESDFRAINSVDVVGHDESKDNRSDSQMHPSNNIPLAALRMANSRASIAGINQYNHQMSHQTTNGGKNYGNRSHSEADLLGNEIYDYDMRNTLSRLRNDNQKQLNQPSMTSQRASVIKSAVPYLTVQVKGLDALPSIRGVSLDVKSGELFAVMATSQREGSALMEVLGGLKKRMSGEILVNGQYITQRGLRRICGYVSAPDKCALDDRMSVQSTLSFHAALYGPRKEESGNRERMDNIVDDLGLTAVRTTNVSKLTHSEKQRLGLACQLLSQPSILILNQSTTNMDIFDTFFLVEYLRQWCNVGGRIVIMTLQPPTFEILSMCSGVLLLSGGRTVFSGCRSDLPRHMGSLGYPCPPFKNPADYYLDLVTLDDLSAAAMLESSARIESLANAWEHIGAENQSQLMPPGSMPSFRRHAGFFGQVLALTKRYVFYKQPSSMLAWISKLVCAAVLSLVVGCIFWDIPSSDPQLDLNDRLGYHHCMMAVALWPLILLTIRDVHEDRKYAEREIKLQMYSRSSYIIVQTFWNILPSLCIWLSFLLPAHSMAGLYNYTAGSDTGIYLFMGYMLLYLSVIHTLARLSAHILPTITASTVFTAFVVLLSTHSGGYNMHLRQAPAYWNWIQSISPQRWLLPLLIADEYSAETLANTAANQLCRNKQVQHQEIIVQHPCPTPNGTALLHDLQLLSIDPQYLLGVFEVSFQEFTISALLIAICVGFALTFVLFVTNCRKMWCKSKSTFRPL